MGKEVLEDRGRTETARVPEPLWSGPACTGRGVAGRQPVGSLAGWSGGGGERVAGKCSRRV